MHIVDRMVFLFISFGLHKNHAFSYLCAPSHTTSEIQAR